MGEWTKEPWHCDDGMRRTAIVDSDGRQVAMATGEAPMHDQRGASTSEIQAANAARIVACVNALAGIPDPAAAIEEVRATLTWIVGASSAENVNDLNNIHHAAMRALRMLGDSTKETT